MDTTQQSKLTKAEWESVEIQVPEDEKYILELIIAGYSDVNIKHNSNKSLFSYTKVDKSEMIESYFYTRFFREKVLEIVKISKSIYTSIANFDSTIKNIKIDKLKTADSIRINNMSLNADSVSSNIIEYVLLNFVKEMITLFYAENRNYAFYLYTLIQLQTISVDHINKHVLNFVDICIQYINSKTILSNIIKNAYEFIEKNPNVFKYGDISLYDHQKRLFNVFRQSHEKYKNSQ